MDKVVTAYILFGGIFGMMWPVWILLLVLP